MMTLGIVLAAGKGTRLKSPLAKVLQPLWGRPLIHRVLDSLSAAGVSQAVCVVGHQAEAVQASVTNWAHTTPHNGSLQFVIQDPPLGTGDAVAKAAEALPTTQHDVTIITAGDVPLIRPETWQAMVATHRERHADLTVMTASLDTPGSYGRLRWNDATGEVLGIVEAKDLDPQDPDPSVHHWVNAGAYCASLEAIRPLLPKLYALMNSNAQKEVYFTDIVTLAVQAGLKVQAFVLGDPHEMQGVNTQEDLAHCHQILNRWTLSRHMANGIRILDPAATWIAPEVTLGAGSTVYPGCLLEGDVTTGAGCVLGPHATLRGPVTLGDRCSVTQSLITHTTTGDDCHLGPFTHLRDGVTLGDRIKVGNFVEMKNASLGADSFASHLAYIGDADLGIDVNWGAGAITANFNPLTWEKHRTTVGNHVKVGSNSVIIAPLTLEDHAFIAAGSVIHEPVPARSLAIARVRQKTTPDWVKVTQSANPSLANT